MRELTTIEHFQQLQPNEKLEFIKGGKCYHFSFCCMHPLRDMSKYFIVISRGSHLDSSVFKIDASGTWLAGDYNSETVGRVMAAQLEREIEVINHIYITK